MEHPLVYSDYIYIYNYPFVHSIPDNPESKERTHPPLRPHPRPLNRQLWTHVQIEADSLRARRVLSTAIKINHVVDLFPTAIDCPVVAIKRRVVTASVSDTAPRCRQEGEPDGATTTRTELSTVLSASASASLRRKKRVLARRICNSSSAEWTDRRGGCRCTSPTPDLPPTLGSLSMPAR